MNRIKKEPHGRGFDEGDRAFMRRALELAAMGLCTASPNPMVGAVVVRDGRIVGEGYHRRAGEPHAEPLALEAAGEASRGATVYVTLEPCCHHGRTPPCADRLIASGVARVVAAMEDPYEEVSGRGFRRLREAGIGVETGLFESEARRLNAAFIKRVTTGLPLVTVKAAVSLDGRMATRTGDSKWITGEAAREEAHRIRARNDCVLVGIGTVLADDPLLTCRLPGDHGQQWRAVLDTRGRMPPGCNLVRTASTERPVFQYVARSAETEQGTAAPTSEQESSAEERLTARSGVRKVVVRESGDGRLDLVSVLRDLANRGANGVMVEGGPRVIAECLRLGLADHLALFIAPIIIGDGEAPSFAAGLNPERIAEALRLVDVETRGLGADLLIEGRVAGMAGKETAIS